MSVIWFEFLLSFRRIRRRPAQTGLTLATLTLSLSLALLSWSLFYTVFRYNPDFDPKGQLQIVTYQGLQANERGRATYGEFTAMKEGQTVFSDFTEVGLMISYFVDTPTGSQRLLGAALSSASLRLVGAQPALGRLFLPEEDKRNGPLAVLLSHHIWQTYFAGDPAIVGRAVQISGFTMSVVGVMPASFRFPNDQDLWLSMSAVSDNQNYPLREGLARLKPGVTQERAEQDLQVILRRLGSASPANRHHYRPVVLPFREYYLGTDIRVSALILFSLSLLFVVVGCVNAANLLLIDFLGRQAETAAALALGVPRRAAVRALCFQVGIMASAAMALSLGILAVFAPFLHRGMAALNAPYWLQFSIGFQHLWMAGALTAAAAAVAVVIPISCLLAVRADEVIRSSLATSRGAGRSRSRRLLLTGQMAVLTVLGVCAALLVGSSFHLSDRRWNYDARKVFLGSLSIAGSKGWHDMNDLARYTAYRRVMDGILRLPGVSSAAYMVRPLGYSAPPNCAYSLDPDDFVQNRAAGQAMTTAVTDQLFATIGVPIIAGSSFPQTSAPAGWTYAIVNASLAARLWPRTEAIHRALYLRLVGADPAAPPTRLLIVGVTRDFQASGPTAVTNDFISTPLESLQGVPSTIYLLATGPVVPTVKEISGGVHAADPSMTLYFTSTIGQQIDLLLGAVHLTTRLTIIFAAASVLLCCIGLYSLTISQVLQSSREFGIRMALGGEPGSIWRRFIGGHCLNVIVGVAAGSLAAYYVSHLLRSLLFGISEHNAATFAGVGATIVAVSILACVPSLFRLKRINPADCLRSL